jgi:hypothetical protein
MSRRITIFLVLAVLALISIAAIAAVENRSIPAVTVVPQIHLDGSNGYFLATVPLPAGVPPGPLAVTAAVSSGDAYLVHVKPPSSPTLPQDGGDEEEVAIASTGREVIIAGRYAKPGPVRITISGRWTQESLKPLMVVAFTLPPSAQAPNPTVRETWARMQQNVLTGSDPEGEDSFSHYWNLAIAPRYGLDSRLHEAISRFRREPPDLYSVFTGAAAIQETLQLDLLGSGQNFSQEERIRTAREAKDNLVSLASLTGPTIKSHPFKEMLKGREPQLPALASVIPDDQYAVFFSNITKQIELADLMDEWGGNLLHQAQASARDFKVREKVTRQLCLENSWLTRMFGERVIADMAFTGSDPFFKEGTAFTVLFSLKDKERFRKQIEKRYAEAVSDRGATRSTFSMDGMNGFSVTSPDREVTSHTLIMDNIAIVSTSKAALQRIVETSARRMPSLAQADDFRYMRTIFPQNAAEEDIFIYLSDAHIRNLVGPRWKIGEARRMRCSGTMTLLANARLWFKAEQRREPTLKDLISGGYLGVNPPVCPDHGSYEIDKAGQPHCSLHNRQGLLTPVGEVPLQQITRQEEAQYKVFLENYNRYWSKFFDPIGIRVKMGKDIRIQTCILPLIENSWYDGMAAFSGRNPGELTESSILPRTIMSIRGHMAPNVLQETSIVQDLKRRGGVNLDWLGDELSLNLCDGQVLFSVGGRAMGLLGQGVGQSSMESLVVGYLGSALNLPTYLSVKVTDTKKAEQGIPALFRTLGPRTGRSEELSVETYSIEDHRGKQMYVANFNLWVIKLRLYSAVVDDRLVIASRKDIIADLLDASYKGGAKPVKHDGSVEMSVYRSAFRQLEDTVNLGWQEDLRHACEKNLPLSGIMLRTLGIAPDSLGSSIAALRGYQPFCPSGGRYLIDEKSGATVCSIHGSRWNPKQPPASDKSSKTLELVNTLERVNARLSFTPEGLMTTVDIKRTK